MEPNSRSTPVAADKKRKRSAPENDRSAVAKEETRAPVRPPPSEEEVEEFFTLLRRIHTAAKGNRSRLVNGGEKVNRVEEEGADNGVMVFDLNAVPDEANEANGC